MALVLEGGSLLLAHSGKSNAEPKCLSVGCNSVDTPVAIHKLQLPHFCTQRRMSQAG